MPRYFFHVHDDRERLDEDGTECADPREARATAVEAAGEMLKEFGCGFWAAGEWRMRVVDEAGRTVCAVRFAAEPTGLPAA